MVLLLLAGVEEAQGEHTPALLHYVIISIFLLQPTLLFILCFPEVAQF